MALINNIYVFCEEEQVTENATLTNYPTESGIPLTDTVRKQAVQVNLTGKIVSYDNYNANDIIDKLNELKNKGSWIQFRGVRAFDKLQIGSFTYSSNYKINGGVEFSMQLVENRVATTAYIKPTTTSTASTKIKEGDVVIFKGGNVYVSSDASQAAAKRGKSTCKLTKISTLAGAKHIYHLISQDCTYGSSNYVYGWVDAKNVTKDEKVSTSATTNAGYQGSQAVKSIQPVCVWHTVKRGDTIFSLVNGPYKTSGVTVAQVIKDNPNCFSKPGDARTLMVGARLQIK